MSMFGALIGQAMGAFGEKPEIPQLPAIDPNAIQAQTIAANAQNIPGLKQQAEEINAFNIKQNLGQLSQALEFIAPGQLAQAQGLVSSQLRGEVPADVAAQLQRRSTAQSLLGGFGGNSGIGRNLSARDFGLTSMGIQQQGLANFSNLASMVPKTAMFDMTSMFYTPQQRMNFAFQERESQFQRTLLANQVAAAPDPGTAALAREIDRFFNTAISAGMTAAGGGMGGGGMGG